MKFKAIVQIKSQKTGIDLFDEYERLGFDKQPKSFGVKQVQIEVDSDFVRAHAADFNGDTTAYYSFDSSITTKDDYEDWGSVGSVLSQSRINAEWLKSKV